MSKYPKIKPLTPSGWSEWLAPKQSYKMACCDCGLVHDLEFKLLKVTEDFGDDFKADELPWGEYRLGMRARRNNRSTGQVRRNREGKGDGH